MKRIGIFFAAMALVIGFGLVTVSAQVAQRVNTSPTSQNSDSHDARKTVADYQSQSGVSIHEYSMPDMDEQKITFLQEIVNEDPFYLVIEVDQASKSYTVVFGEEATAEKVEANLIGMLDWKVRKAGN